MIGTRVRERVKKITISSVSTHAIDRFIIIKYVRRGRYIYIYIAHHKYDHSILFNVVIIIVLTKNGAAAVAGNYSRDKESIILTIESIFYFLFFKRPHYYSVIVGSQIDEHPSVWLVYTM